MDWKIRYYWMLIIFFYPSTSRITQKLGILIFSKCQGLTLSLAFSHSSPSAMDILPVTSISVWNWRRSIRCNHNLSIPTISSNSTNKSTNNFIGRIWKFLFLVSFLCVLGSVSASLWPKYFMNRSHHLFLLSLDQFSRLVDSFHWGRKGVVDSFRVCIYLFDSCFLHSFYIDFTNKNSYDRSWRTDRWTRVHDSHCRAIRNSDLKKKTFHLNSVCLFIPVLLNVRISSVSSVLRRNLAIDQCSSITKSMTIRLFLSCSLNDSWHFT